MSARGDRKGRRWSSGASAPLRAVAHRGAGRLRSWTRRWRSLPDFLVIGAQRAGTSSFFDLLARHPDVRPSVVKEVHFFDRFYAEGAEWYRAQFPMGLPSRTPSSDSNSARIGEATPYYLFHPAVPARVRSLLPEIRLIALLRDPVDRAYSHYSRERRLGREGLDFEEALRREEERLDEDRRRAGDPVKAYDEPAHRYYSYLARGRYAEQLERWLEHFPREQLLVVESERFYGEPLAVLEEVLAFLDLRAWRPSGIRRVQQGHYEGLDEGLRRELREYFADSNRRLEQLIGKELSWMR